MRRRTILGGVLAAVAVAAFLERDRLRTAFRFARAKAAGRRTLDEALAEYGDSARARLSKRFEAAGASYPPKAVTLVGLKAERRLEVWAETEATPVLVADLPVIALSGGPGPKLKEGDRQAPEGLYPITYLNPASLYHLSLRVGYPNADDQARAAAEGRTNLGGDIMIHGQGGSIGCYSLSDADVEEVFVLAADVGIQRVRAILAPQDMRNTRMLQPPTEAPAWTADLYREIAAAMARFRH